MLILSVAILSLCIIDFFYLIFSTQQFKISCNNDWTIFLNIIILIAFYVSIFKSSFIYVIYAQFCYRMHIIIQDNSMHTSIMKYLQGSK